jgi:hypothetical protein
MLDIALLLNDAGDTTFNAESADEASRIYKLLQGAANTGKCGRQILDLVERAPPRD